MSLGVKFFFALCVLAGSFVAGLFCGKVLHEGTLMSPARGQVYTVGIAAYPSADIGQSDVRYYRIGILCQPGEQFLYMGDGKWVKAKIEK